MKDILIIAGCTLRRYIKNPIALVLFLGAPILVFAFLTGSGIENYFPDVKGFPGTCLQNSYVAPLGGLRTVDKECIIFMLMLIFYFAVLSFHAVTSDLKNGLSDRIKAAPTGPMKIVAGKFIGSFILILSFLTVILLTGKFLFQINFGSNFLVTCTALFLFCLITNSLGFIFAGFVRNIYVCFVLDFCIDFPMMFSVMTKSLSPSKMPPLFTFLLKISLHNYVLDAVLNAGIPYLTPILLVAAVTVPLSFIAGRWVLR
ncbi:MAG TPA: ABC transporter permease [Ruminiclostridium sp.]|nr:ABC transporter permease [Ruminiclostridium sp.]